VLFRWKTEPVDDADLTPEERDAYIAAVDRIREDQLRALRDPGPTWREWFYYDAMKWWLGLLYLVVDSWILVSWISGVGFSPLGVAGMLVSTGVALYFEVLFYRYLWLRPSDDTIRKGPFRPSWHTLREFGRWTPEEVAMRSGKLRRPTAQDGAPDAHEFL
jgi:hypothetical protein